MENIMDEKHPQTTKSLTNTSRIWLFPVEGKMLSHRAVGGLTELSAAAC